MFPLADPSLVLAGALLFLLGVSGVLALLLRRQAVLAWPLAAAFGTMVCLWLGLLVLDLTRVFNVDQPPQIIQPRWVLFPAAIILLISSTIILMVYGEHASGDHAWEYRLTIRLSILATILGLVGVLAQPLFR